MIDEKQIKKVIEYCRLKYEVEAKKGDYIIFYNKNTDIDLIQKYINMMSYNADILRIEHEKFYIINMSRCEEYCERFTFPYNTLNKLKELSDIV